MNVQMSDINTENKQPSSEPVYTSAQLLSQLGLKGTSLIASVSYHETQILKQGMDLWLTKLPVTKKLTPFKNQYRQLDLDLSCVLLDDDINVIKTIWFGDLGDNHTIYHLGDGLAGAKNFEEQLINQEEIHIRLPLLLEKIPKATYLLFFISSFCHHPLYQAKKGFIKLMDNEGNSLHKLSLSQLSKEASALLIYQLTKIDDEFLLSVPSIMLNSDNQNAKQFIKSLTDFAKNHVALEKSKNHISNLKSSNSQ